MSESGAPITPLGGSTFRLARPDGTHVVAYGVADGARTWVFLDGVTYVVEPARRDRPGGGQDEAALAAPMPATVTQIHVATSQAVAPGDLLLTLEAMKMELPIRATTNATVTAINCRVGELVQAGTVLVELQNSDIEPANQSRGPDQAAAARLGSSPARATSPGTEPEPRTGPEHEPRTRKEEA